MDRELCEHWNTPNKCKHCDNKPKIKDLILWMLSEYDWTSSEQTKKEFVQELEERIRKG